MSLAITDFKVMEVKNNRTYNTPKSRIFVWPKGESVIQNLENRHCRPYTTYKKEVIPEILKKLELPEGTKVKWSQYAGCTCPCSPGFIIEGHYGQDIHATVVVE